METLIETFGPNALFMAGVAAMVTGVALFYLVMQRTIKHRENTKDAPEAP